jgi:hypothetical protein
MQENLSKGGGLNVTNSAKKLYRAKWYQTNMVSSSVKLLEANHIKLHKWQISTKSKQDE